MPIIGDDSGTTITGNAINWYQCQVILRSLDLYLRTGMSLSRVATPARLRELTTAYTGVTYARSRKGLEAARTDMQKLLDSRSPDEVTTLAGAAS